MYRISETRRFQRSLHKLKRSGTLTANIVDDLRVVLCALRDGERIPVIYRDHALAGQFSGHRECHIKGDLLLVYQKNDIELVVDLVDIGTHSQIFG